MRRRGMPTVFGGAMVAALAIPRLARAAEGVATASRGVAERFASTLSAHDMASFAALFAEDYRNHQTSAAAPPRGGGVSDKQASVAFFQARLTGLPDLQVSIEAIVAAEDRVAASFSYTGTHQGRYFGVAPTGRRLTFTSCDIFRVRDGLLAEHWGMGDLAGVLAQLKT